MASLRLINDGVRGLGSRRGAPWAGAALRSVTSGSSDSLRCPAAPEGSFAPAARAERTPIPTPTRPAAQAGRERLFNRKEESSQVRTASPAEQKLDSPAGSGAAWLSQRPHGAAGFNFSRYRSNVRHARAGGASRSAQPTLSLSFSPCRMLLMFSCKQLLPSHDGSTGSPQALRLPELPTALPSAPDALRVAQHHSGSAWKHQGRNKATAGGNDNARTWAERGLWALECSSHRAPHVWDRVLLSILMCFLGTDV